ncbi:MAG: glycosyltransferase [Eubacteriales bacterium]|nr:glycosyltransferase [Eubacteriales bacterium]
MRIGIFTDAYVPQIGGVSTASQLIKNHLNALGHEAYVITTTEKNTPEEKNVIRIPSLPFFSEKRVGGNFDPKISQEVKELKLDLVHTQTEYGVGLMGKGLAKQQGIPHIHTFHTLYDNWMYGQLGENGFSHFIVRAMNKYLRYFLKNCDEIIVPTPKAKAFVEGYELGKTLTILPTGIELDKFFRAGENHKRRQDLRKEYGIPEDAFSLLYVGRISQEKKIDVVLEHFFPLLRQGEEIYFFIVGSGPKLDEYRHWVDRERLGKYIKLVGSVPIDQVQDYYAVGDVFVCASESETQGLTYIEALATGLPILVYPDPCLDQVFLDGVNGLSFTNAKEFSEAVLNIKNTPDQYQRLSEGAKKYSQKYSVDHFINNLIEIYERHLA